MIGAITFLLVLVSIITKMIIDVQKSKKRRTQEENELLNEIKEENTI